MESRLIRPELEKLKQKLRRARVASWSAIEQGDCRAVARLTCQAARLRDAITLVERAAI